MEEKDKEYLKCLFPEAFSGNTLDKKFFSDLLSINLFDVIKKYASVKEYFEIAFFSSLLYMLKNLFENHKKTFRINFSGRRSLVKKIGLSLLKLKPP